MKTNLPSPNSGHVAVARALNLPISTKHCVEICRSLRFKDVSYAKKFLEEVSVLQRAVPYKKFLQDTGHKAGMSSGRYPQKAAKEILRLLKSVEANAQAKGLDTSNLKIIKLLANKAPIPFSGGRHRTGTKRTHVEVEVRERFAQLKKGVKKEEVKTAQTPEVKTTAVKKEEKSSHSVPFGKNAPNVSEVGDVPNGTKEEVKAETRVINEEAPKREQKPAEEEPSSEELLRRAQLKAAELKKREKAQKETKEVTDLYDQLQKKGSLRSPKGAAK